MQTKAFRIRTSNSYSSNSSTISEILVCKASSAETDFNNLSISSELFIIQPELHQETSLLEELIK